MMRQRAGPPPDQPEEDSSSEDDAFSRLSRKSKKQKVSAAAPRPSVPQPSRSSGPIDSGKEAPLRVGAATLPLLTTTSSMKRHHKEMSDTRKAKMDALLTELETEKKNTGSTRPEKRFVPVKKGSFVDPDEEHVTTNLFVGNLAPTITEEEVTDLFRQFGDLYSVKIMWPRTAEARARERHTGFVCFMHRQDAEDAIASCNDADVFHVGRRLVMRWGKNVKKITKSGAGGMSIAPIQQKSAETVGATQISQRQPTFDQERDGSSAIRVTVPQSKERAGFISTVASYVAKDGAAFEEMLLREHAEDPLYTFLVLPSDPTSERKEEYIYYRWRVYGFAQGDGLFVWRAEPFVMLHPNGCFWIPPPMDTDAARQESEHRQKREEWLEREKQQRRAQVHRRDVTGRQLERARIGGPDGGSRLTAEEMDKFNTLTRRNLSGSRESICAAMAFCFDKSGAARQISEKLEELVLEDGQKIGTDTRVARLYLLSDILFNSQQPGIKNAFLYRSAIESFSPDAFASLGTHGRGSLGRLSEKKLSVAVSRVLSAWTAWSVYTPIFIDQLQDRYEGIETKPSATEETHGRDKEEEEAIMEEEVPTIGPDDAELVSTRRKGTWQEVDEESESQTHSRAKLSVSQKEVASEWIPPASRDADNGVTDGDPAYHDGETWDADGELLDADGDPLDPDGDPLDPDGDPLEADGEPLDPDGEPLEADGDPLDPDGEALDADGDPLDPDGEPLDADGDPLDPDGDPLEADGEPLDPDGEPLDADGDSLDPDGEPLEADGEVLC